jgi:hypothetical protein
MTLCTFGTAGSRSTADSPNVFNAAMAPPAGCSRNGGSSQIISDAAPLSQQLFAKVLENYQCDMMHATFRNDR